MAPQDERCILISEAERVELQRLARGHSTAQAVARRARIVLARAVPGATDTAVATALEISRPSVAMWRRRYLEHGLPGLGDAPRCGTPRRIGDGTIMRLVALALGEVPPGASGWSTRSLARQVGMSQTAVSRILRGFGLQLPDPASIAPSLEPALIRSVRDMVGIYVDPADLALVLCAPQAHEIEALSCTTNGRQVPWSAADETRLDRPQQGMCELFAALQARVSTASRPHDRQRHRLEIGAFLERVDASTPADSELHLLLGCNASPYLHKAWQALAAVRPCCLHSTPAGACWFNLAKCWFAVLADRDGHGRPNSARAFEAALRQHLASADAGGFAWTGAAGTAVADRPAEFGMAVSQGVLEPDQQAPEGAFGRGRIPPIQDEDGGDDPVLVHRAPGVVQHAVDAQDTRSRCQVSSSPGRLRHSLAAKSAPNRKHQRRSLS